MFRRDREFQHQLIRTLGHVYYRGADVGEAMAAAERVEEGDREAWYQVWRRFADREAELAAEAERSENRVSCRESYYRAAEYLRQAIFFLRDDLSDPRILSSSRRIQGWFSAAASLDRFSIEPVEIPFGRHFLPGYLALATRDERRPLVIVIQGYDGIAEEGYYTGGLAALERGYHCLLLDGPGQGHALYQQGLTMRPDWENVIAPVIDWVVHHQGVDPSHIALIGHGLGGYFALRAASKEHRLSAVVANPPQYSLIQTVAQILPGNLWDRFCGRDEEGFDHEVKRMMEHHSNLHFVIGSRMAAHGKSHPYEWLEDVTRFTNEGLIEEISCPTLACYVEEDRVDLHQEEQLYNALKCEKKRLLFPKEAGAGDSSEVMAQSLFCSQAFNWLDPYLRSPVSA